MRIFTVRAALGRFAGAARRVISPQSLPGRRVSRVLNIPHVGVHVNSGSITLANSHIRHIFGMHMDVRIRLPELMQKAEIPTAYALSIRSGERISMSTAHRLVRAKGAVRYLDADLLDVLCDVFGVGPEALLTQDPPPSASGAQRRRATPKRRGRG